MQLFSGSASKRFVDRFIFASLSRMQRRGVTYLIALATIVSQSAGELIMVPRDTESKVDETTYFNCSTNLLSGEIFWYHGDKYIYTGSVIFEPYSRRFEIDINASKGAHNLVIHSVEPGDAGVYSCIDDDGTATRKSAQLIVLGRNPQCHSNIQPDGVIGQNVFNIAPDEVQLSCNVIYHGNVPPKLEWKKVGDNNFIKDNVTSNVASNNRYIYTLTLKGHISLDKSSYVCQTTRSSHDQYSCTSETIKVLYFIGGNTTQVNISRGEELTCNVSNYTFDCTNQWYHNKNTCPLSCGVTFTTHLLGEYQCRVKCHIRGKDYEFSATKAFVHEETTPSGSTSITLIVLASIIVAILLLSLLAFIVYKKRKEESERKKHRRIFLDTSKRVNHGRMTYEDMEQLIGKDKEGNEVQASESKCDADKYASEGVLIKKIDDKSKAGKKPIWGLTILDDKLYFVTQWSSKIQVYDSNNFAYVDKLEVKDMEDPEDIVSCNKKKCLYISDYKPSSETGEILKVNPQGKLIKKWPTEYPYGHLSVTRNGNIILTVYLSNVLVEYTPEGVQAHKIVLLAGLNNQKHGIELPNGNIVICSSGPLHRIYEVDKRGEIVRSSGGMKVSTFGEMDVPIYMAVDEAGFVMVADRENSRVLLFDSNLKCIREILPKGTGGLQLPARIYLDEANMRLLVVDNERQSVKKTEQQSAKESVKKSEEMRWIDGHILVFDIDPERCQDETNCLPLLTFNSLMA